MLVGYQSEAGRAIAECRTENGHILLVGRVNDRVNATLIWRLAVCLEVGTHGADELTRTIGARIKRIRDLFGSCIANAKLFFIDERVLDAVDHQFAEHSVFGALLEEVVGNPMLVAESFEEVLIDDVGAGRDHCVHHDGAYESDENLLQASADQRAGKAEDDAALFVAEHALINRSCPVEVTGAEGHVLHGVYQSDDVVLLDVDVLDRVNEKFLFCRHSHSRISTIAASLQAICVNLLRLERRM